MKESIANELEDFAIGEKIKELRKSKGVTLKEIAKATGFSTALISQIENNNVSPPIATLMRISKFLGVKISYFFEEKNLPVEVVKKHERRKIKKVISPEGTDHGYIYESLSFRKKNRIMDPFILIVEPGMRYEENLYNHDGEEFLFIIEGEVEMIVGDEKYILTEGDSIYFDSTKKHRLLSHSDKISKVIAVVAK